MRCIGRRVWDGCRGRKEGDTLNQVTAEGGVPTQKNDFEHRNIQVKPDEQTAPWGGNISHGGDKIARGGDNISHGGDKISHGGDKIAHGGDSISHGGDNIAQGGDKIAHGGGKIAHGDDKRAHPLGRMHVLSCLKLPFSRTGCLERLNTERCYTMAISRRRLSQATLFCVWGPPNVVDNWLSKS